MPLSQWGVVIAVALVATVFDVTSRRVPNLLTGPVFVAGVMFATWTRGFTGLGEALAGAALLATPYVILFVFADGGAGDAKLMGSLGAWLGLVDGAITLAAVAFAGVALALLYALLHGRFRSVVGHLREIAVTALSLVYRHRRWAEAKNVLPGREDMLTMPYSMAVLVGVFVAMGVVQVWNT